MTDGTPVQDVLYWAHLDFAAVVVALVVALVNTLVTVRNLVTLGRVLRHLEEPRAIVWPGEDELMFRRRTPDHPEGRRLVRRGEEYTTGEPVELEEPEPYPEPDVAVQGEPWGWTKPGPRPRGWREDGHYGADPSLDTEP